MKKIVGYILITIGTLITFYGIIDILRLGSKTQMDFNTFIGFIITILPILIGIILIKKQKKFEENITTKKCKFCMSEININARVCPICRKTNTISISAIIVTIFISLIIFVYIIFPLLFNLFT